MTAKKKSATTSRTLWGWVTEAEYNEGKCEDVVLSESYDETLRYAKEYMEDVPEYDTVYIVKAHVVKRVSFGKLIVEDM